MRRPLKLVLSAPSGTGKDTVLDQVLYRGVELHRTKSWTTKPPVPGEKKYHHVSHEEFMRAVERGWFREWEVNFNHHLYGTCIHGIPEGADTISEIDCKGALKLKASDPDYKLIFLFPPNYFELERRLRRRGRDTAEQLEKRLQTASVEMAAALQFDALIVNKDIHDAATRLLLLILMLKAGASIPPGYRNVLTFKQAQATFPAIV